MTLDKKDLDEVRRLGKFASSQGLASSTCPYDTASADPDTRARASAWMRAYLHHRPPAGRVDYSGDGTV